MDAITTYKVYLMQSTDSGSSYTKLVDIKDFPDLGNAPEKLDKTTLSDPIRLHENGIQDIDDLTFTTNYNKVDFTALKALEDNTDKYFAVWFGGSESGGVATPDGSDGKFSFTGKPFTYVQGGGVNEIVDMQISIALSSPIVFA